MQAILLMSGCGRKDRTGEGFQISQRQAWRERRSVGVDPDCREDSKPHWGTCNISWGQLGALDKEGQAKVRSVV